MSCLSLQILSHMEPSYLLQHSPVTVMLHVARVACRRGARRAWGLPPSAAAGR